MDQLRRLYNSIDALFDWASLTERVQLTRAAGSENVPITARQALGLCKPIATDFDRRARFMLIVAPDGTIQSDGTSSKWEFFFDLPRRRAHMIAVWYLPWSEEADAFAVPQIDVTVNPFPPPDSMHRQLVRDGKLLRKQLIGMWQKEYRRRPPLPYRFRDSDAVMAELAQKGLDITRMEVTLKAECRTGEGPLWSADAGHTSYHAQFV